MYFYLIMESAEWTSLGQAIPLTMPPTSLKFGGGVFFSYAARIIALVESVTPAPCQSVSALEKESEREICAPTVGSGDTLFEFQISKHTPAAI